MIDPHHLAARPGLVALSDDETVHLPARGDEAKSVHAASDMQLTCFECGSGAVSPKTGTVGQHARSSFGLTAAGWNWPVAPAKRFPALRTTDARFDQRVDTVPSAMGHAGTLARDAGGMIEDARDPHGDKGVAAW